MTFQPRPSEERPLVRSTEMASRPILELESVTKTYPGEPPVIALQGVTLSIDEGELVAIVGPSGSGKTTLLQLMGTLDQPSSGTVRVAGFDVTTMSDRELSALRAERIGFIFQQFFLAVYAHTNLREAAFNPRFYISILFELTVAEDCAQRCV